MAGYIGSKTSVVSSGAERKKVFTITTTTTSLTGLTYTPNLVHVFHNGIRLVDGTDYTATNGTTITLTNAALSGDEVVVVSYATFQTSDTVSASAGGTFSNPITVEGDGATVLTVDRATSDGAIVDFQKDGGRVGSIGTLTADPWIARASGCGVRFITAAYIPTNDTGNNNDDAVDLGYPSVRFKDLYLSGGVYLGGTGAANYLDDYEEGTWTPTAPTGWTIASQWASYIKIGNQVTVKAKIFIDGESTGNFSISGLPFTGKAGLAQLTGPVMYEQISFSGSGDVVSFVESAVSRLDFWYMSQTGGAWTQWTSAETTTNTELYVNATYFVA